MAVARSQARELSRRRLALAMLMMLPLVFYWTSSSDEFAPVFAAVGIGWAFAVTTLFLTQGMRTVTPRMVMLGFRIGDILAGRLLCAASFGAVVATAMFLYVRLDDVIVNEKELALAFLFAVLGSVALGLAVGALVDREMEAMLLIIAIIGIQLVVEPTSRLAKVLPLYAAERQASAAAGRGDSGGGGTRCARPAHHGRGCTLCQAGRYRADPAPRPRAWNIDYRRRRRHRRLWQPCLAPFGRKRRVR